MMHWKVIKKLNSWPKNKEIRIFKLPLMIVFKDSKNKYRIIVRRLCNCCKRKSNHNSEEITTQ